MSRLLVVFAPGAGAPSSSAWMQRWARRLEALGEVRRIDYPYMLSGKRSPDPLPKLIAAHRAAIAEARRGHDGPVVLAGKSMGGRVGCHAALEEPVSALVCLGYPLKGAGKKNAIRDEVLVALRTPVLFVQGTRDPLCPLDLLATTRARMTAKSELFVVEGGNHSLDVTATALKAQGATQEAVDAHILETIRSFVAEATA